MHFEEVMGRRQGGESRPKGQERGKARKKVTTLLEKHISIEMGNGFKLGYMNLTLC